MVRLADLHPEEAEHMLAMTPPAVQKAPWIQPPPLKDCKIALLTSSAIHRRSDPAFKSMDRGYRLIPADVDFADVVQSHVSVNFDRSGYQQDYNVVFPLDRLKELASRGEIGGVADWHYSFVGAQGDPRVLESMGQEVARLMKEEGVDAALIGPV